MLPASLVTFLGTAVWLWLVPQSPAVTVPAPGGDRVIAALGALTVGTPMLQLVTQVALASLGLAMVLVCVVVVLLAYLRRDIQPRQTLFGDVMPVGRQVAFTAGQSRGDSAAGGSGQ
jgi:type III secretory pathway component EscS